VALYTERIIAQGEGVIQTRFTVPHAKRCVVTNLLVCSLARAPSAVDVNVGGKYIAIWSIPEAWTTRTLECRAVAYAGEQVVLGQPQGDTHVTITGYLFDDPIGPPAASKPIEPDAPARPQPKLGRLDGDPPDVAA